MKLALGTVQFGMDYGAFNVQGRPTLKEVRTILDLAHSGGIRLLDTARAYGDSEMALAQAEAPARFEIVTKCPSLGTATDANVAITESFDASCAALGVSSVYGYLLHDSSDIKRPGAWETLQELVRAGRTKRVGVAAYNSGEIEGLYDAYPMTLVQLPANVLDPWFRSSHVPTGVELHVRSIFLQGFLLSEPDHLPNRFQPWRRILMDFRARAAAHQLSPLQAALAPLLACPQVARVVVGVETHNQIDSILTGVQTLETQLDISLGSFSGVPAELTDPRKWL